MQATQSTIGSLCMLGLQQWWSKLAEVVLGSWLLKKKTPAQNKRRQPSFQFLKSFPRKVCKHNLSRSSLIKSLQKNCFKTKSTPNQLQFNINRNFSQCSYQCSKSVAKNRLRLFRSSRQKSTRLFDFSTFDFSDKCTGLEDVQKPKTAIFTKKPFVQLEME